MNQNIQTLLYPIQIFRTFIANTDPENEERKVPDLMIGKDEFQKRVGKLKKWMEKKYVDASLFFPGSNMLYLSGTKNAGLLVVPIDGDPFLLARYAFGDALAEEESPFELKVVKPYYGIEKKQVKSVNLLKEAKNVLVSHKIRVKRLGVEKSRVATLKEVRKVFRVKRRSVPFLDAGSFVENLRMVKSSSEIDLIKKSAEISAKALEYVVDDLKPGVMEKTIANKLEFLMRDLGASDLAFPSIVAFGENTFNAHHVPTERKLKEGDLVLFDWGAKFSGYCSDTTRTFVYGKPSSKIVERFEAVSAAQNEGLNAVKAGVPYEYPDVASRKVLEKYGLVGEFVHSLGHGLGLDVHEMPRLLVGAKGKLKEGMVVTVEPGVYIKGWGGIRIEDTVVVREDRAEVLTTGIPKGMDFLKR